MFRLEATDDLGRVLAFPLKEQGLVTIGRNTSNDITLPDKSVSRNHCLLYIKGETVEIEDLDSANGVIVRGVRIKRRTPINEGDEIILGENRFFLYRTDQQDQTGKTIIDSPPFKPDRA